ncbi:DUF6340 family protein [Bacteroidota bacterium]
MKNKSYIKNSISIFNYLVIILIIFLLSCTTVSYVETEVLEPAKHSFPDKLKNLVVINRKSFDYTKEKSKSGILFFGKEDKYLKVFDELLTDFFIGILLENTNNESPFLFKRPNQELNIRKNKFNFIQKLNHKEVLDITKPVSADGILSFEACSFHDNYKLSMSQDGTFEGIIQIIIRSEWILYDKHTNNSESFSFADTSFIDIFGDTKNELLENIPELKIIFKECGLNAGLNLLYNISPNWIPADRYYFINFFNTKMRNGHNYAKKGDWENASYFWKQVIDRKNPLFSSKASFNMALASEMLGNPDIAWEWIKDLKMPLWNEYIEDYKKELKIRIAAQMELDKHYRF